MSHETVSVVRFDFLKTGPVRAGWIEVKIPTIRIPGRMLLDPSDLVAWHFGVQEHEMRSRDAGNSWDFNSPHAKPLLIDSGRLFLVGGSDVSIRFVYNYEQHEPRARRSVEIQRQGLLDSANRYLIRDSVVTGFTDAGTQYDLFRDAADRCSFPAARRLFYFCPTRSAYGNPHPLGWHDKAVQLGDNARYMGEYVPPVAPPEDDEKIAEAIKNIEVAQSLLETTKQTLRDL